MQPMHPLHLCLVAAVFLVCSVESQLAAPLLIDGGRAPRHTLQPGLSLNALTAPLDGTPVK
jgi:hypothetical protein